MKPAALPSLAVIVALGALPLYALIGVQPVKRLAPAQMFEERLAHLGPVIVRLSADEGLQGEWFSSQETLWVARGMVTRSAGNGPATPSRPSNHEPGGIASGDDRASIVAHLPSGTVLEDIHPIQTREGRLVYVAPDGVHRSHTKKGATPSKLVLAYGAWAKPPLEPDYATLLRQPLLKLHVDEDRSAGVPAGKRRFTVSASVFMAVPDPNVPEGSSEGPIQEVYAERTTVEVLSTIGDSPDVEIKDYATGFAMYQGAADPDLEAAMNLAVPRVLDDFAVRLGAARIKHDPRNGTVGAPGLDEAGKAAIVEKASRPLPGWRL